MAPSALRQVPVIAVGLQLVGLNVNPGRLIVHVDVLDLQRDAVDDRAGSRSGPAGVGRDRQRRGVRVDFDLRADDHAVARGCCASSRSNGPAFAGLTIDRPNGAPS